MEPTTAINTSLIIVMFFSLIWVWIFSYRSYFIDDFRDRVFHLRDELFDLAAQGNIAFDHPAYYRVRQLMNGSIRFAESISIWYFIYTNNFMKNDKESSKFLNELKADIETIENIEVQKKIKYFLNCHRLEVIRHIVMKNLFLNIIILFILGLSKISRGCQNIYKKWKDGMMKSHGIQIIENDSYIHGGT